MYIDIGQRDLARSMHVAGSVVVYKFSPYFQTVSLFFFVAKLPKYLEESFIDIFSTLEGAVRRKIHPNRGRCIRSATELTFYGWTGS